MKLKQLLLSALAMVAATTGYAQDISSIVTADEGITVYDSNDYWELGNNGVSYTDWNNQGEYYYYLTFESESDIEVSFDVDVVIDNNATLMINFDDSSSDMYLNYEPEGKHITHTFDAGEHTITFMYGRWDDMIIDPEWGTPELENQRAEIYNIMAKCLCQHEFPEISEIPATCTEPSKSHCTKCEKLLSDGNSEALSHDYVKGVCKRCGAMDRSCAANADGISLTIDDKDSEYPWKLVDENDPSKGLMSTNQGMHSTTSDLYFTLECEYDYTVSFDWKVSSEAGYDCLDIYVDDVPKKTYIFGETQSSFEYRFDKDTTHSIHLRYSKDVSTSDGDDTAYISNIKISCELDATNDGLIEVEDIVMGINMLGNGNLTEEQLNEIIEFILHKE